MSALRYFPADITKMVETVSRKRRGWLEELKQTPSNVTLR